MASYITTAQNLIRKEREQMAKDNADRELAKYGTKTAADIDPLFPNNSMISKTTAGNKRTNKRRKNKRNTMRKKRKIGRRRK
jgi:hypothetical protein